MSDTSTSLTLIAAAVIPSLIFVALLNSVDLEFGRGLRWRVGRPWTVVWFAFAMGALSAWPAYRLECLFEPVQITNLFTLLAFTVLIIGMIEEGCKFAAFYLGPGLTRWFAEEYDGILFAAVVSLGFATVENLLYIH